SYLTQIGLSEAAVVYITQAAPTEMTLLTLRDAEKIGIEVLPFEQPIPATKSDKRVTSRETSNQEIANRAQLFVKEINSRYSRTNSVEWLGLRLTAPGRSGRTIQIPAKYRKCPVGSQSSNHESRTSM